LKYNHLVQFIRFF